VLGSDGIDGVRRGILKCKIMGEVEGWSGRWWRKKEAGGGRRRRRRREREDEAARAALFFLQKSEQVGGYILDGCPHRSDATVVLPL
jgi:hypothetical protein